MKNNGMMGMGQRAVLVWLCILTASAICAQAASSAEPGVLWLWYDKPAGYTKKPTEDLGQYRTLFDQAVLIGNGRLGAMIQGGVAKELVRTSENTLWTGGLNPDGYYDHNMGRFQALGDLVIELAGQEPATHYRRSLDVSNALAGVTYFAHGTNYRREYFASHPDQVIAIRLTADRPGQYTGSLRFTDAHERLASVEKNRMTIPGGLSNGLRYETQIVCINEDGTQEIHSEQFDEEIRFTNCNSLTILLTAGTDYAMDFARRYRSGENPHIRVSRQMDAAVAQSYEKLRQSHIADYQSLFNRFSIDLGVSSEAQRSLPTDIRRLRAAEQTDPEFEQMACQYGRYLMIASSRAGGVAANGQGLWNDCNFPQYGARYTNDLAPTEMAYWSVEPCNLAECHLPLLDLIESQIPAWRNDTRAAPELKTVSEKMTTRGWETRGNHNIMGGQSHWWNKGGNAWYCHHFWEHYAFSQDEDYLRKVVYPLLKETCEYWEDHLKPLPDGRLVVPDFWSPEHGPFHVDGVSYSQELVWDLFTNYLDACDILKIDKPYRAKVAEMRDRLLKPGIGSWGQLLEWMRDMKDAPSLDKREQADEAHEGHIDTPQNSHRHTSHLLGVYPLRQISYEQTPELAAAAKVSLLARGNGGGIHPISFGARAPIFARLYEGDLAYDQIRRHFAVARDNLHGSEFDAAPALPGIMAEMLLQSHQNDLHLLPALPKAWPSGSVNGLRARGGFVIDESWKQGKLISVTIRSLTERAVDVRYGNEHTRISLHPGESVNLNGDLQPGK
jgi:alpha-L-fucosidase 2